MARTRFVVAVILAATAVAFGQSSFVNWESPHVHPLDLNEGGGLLLAVNTADNRLEVFNITSGTPVSVASIPVGLDPVSVRARSQREAWVVNQTSDTVSVVDLEKFNVIATIATDDEPADIVFAGDPLRAYVSCSQANTLLVIDPDAPAQPIVDLADVVGDVGHANATVRLPVRGEDPRALAVSADQREVYVALFESGNATTILGGGDLSGGTLFVPNTVDSVFSPYFDPSQPPALGVNPPNPPPNSGASFVPPIDPALPSPPRVGLIVQRNGGGQWMDDNAHNWTDVVSGANAAESRRPPGWDLQDRDVAILDTTTHGLTYAGGMMNICMAIAVRPSDGLVTIVGTDATNVRRFEPVLNGRFLRVRVGGFDPVGPANTAFVDLNSHLVYTNDIPFDPIPQAQRDLSIGDPRGIVWNAAGTLAFVTGMGSNNVIAINAVGARVTATPILVGEGPTGVALDESRDRLYVMNKFSGSISTINLATNTEFIPPTPFFDPTPVAIKQGRKHLYNTNATSGLGHTSCGSCHVDARTDRLAWDLGDPTGEMRPFNQNCNSTPGAQCADWHPMKGPMVTQTLQDIIEKEPHHWRGDRNGIEEFNGAFTSLLGDDEMLTDVEMQEFEDFLASIHFPPNPFRARDNTLPINLSLPGHHSTGRFAGSGGLAAGEPLPPGDAERGLLLYRQPGMDGGLACVSCHTLPTGMGPDGVFDGGQFVPLPPGPNGEHHLTVVSADGSTNRTMKIAQLRNMYDKVGFDTTQMSNLSGFGFLHDGSVDSITRFISLPAFNVGSDQDIADLVAFMMTFAGSDLPLGDPFNVLEMPGPPSRDTHAAVGWQLTVGGAGQTAGVDPILAQMLLLADAQAVGLVAKGIRNGEHRGYAYIGNDVFQSDRVLEQVATSVLLSSGGPDEDLTLTVVPFGTERRIGVDRDQDGFLDQDEIDACSDPADPNSTPPNCVSCQSDVDCPDTSFCKFAEGICSVANPAGTCTEVPGACPAVLDPVCGCDNMTYASECEADAARVSVAYAGNCMDLCCRPEDEPGVSGGPICVEGASCCSDGTWRCNDGSGASTCPLPGIVCGQVCGGIASIPCGGNEFCKFALGDCCCDLTGTCTPTPGGCPDNWDPVCGCDGVTYGNECEADAVGAAIFYLGECDPNCTAPPAVTLLTDDIKKNRYLTIRMPPLEGPIAIRVTLTELSAFPHHDGERRWVGRPSLYPEENTAMPTLEFLGAGLQCEPYFDTWNSGRPLQVFGGEIVPDAVYEIDVVEIGCAPYIESPGVFSPATTIESAVWGDIVTPFADSSTERQPDFRDIGSVVAKFLAAPDAPIKARAQLQPNVVFPNRPIDFNDVAAAVAAFVGDPYEEVIANAGPCPCPSNVKCGVTECTGDADCGPGFCIDDFCTDACGRCTP